MRLLHLFTSLVSPAICALGCVTPLCALLLLLLASLSSTAIHVGCDSAMGLHELYAHICNDSVSLCKERAIASREQLLHVGHLFWWSVVRSNAACAHNLTRCVAMSRV
jgi:hypothetical protein